MNIKEQIEEQKRIVNESELFAVKYSAKLPEDLGNFGFTSIYAYYSVNLETKEPDECTRALAFVGEVFGRGQWEATLEYRGRHFDWAKKVDGVKVIIYAARKLGQPESFPVDPKEFPLQLEDVA